MAESSICIIVLIITLYNHNVYNKQLIIASGFTRLAGAYVTSKSVTIHSTHRVIRFTTPKANYFLLTFPCTVRKTHHASLTLLYDSL